MAEELLPQETLCVPLAVTWQMWAQQKEPVCLAHCAVLVCSPGIAPNPQVRLPSGDDSIPPWPGAFLLLSPPLPHSSSLPFWPLHYGWPVRFPPKEYRGASTRNADPRAQEVLYGASEQLSHCPMPLKNAIFYASLAWETLKSLSSSLLESKQLGREVSERLGRQGGKF